MSVKYFLYGFVGAGARGGEESRLRLVLRDRHCVVIGLLRYSVDYTVVGPHNFVHSVRGAVAKIVLSLVRLRAVVVVGGYRVLAGHRGVGHASAVGPVGRLRGVGRAVLAHQRDVREHI